MYKEQAKKMIEAIKNFSKDPEALENFECYLEYCFEAWYEKYANTPENLVNELYDFSAIYMEVA